jgi:hypothetical protein
MPTTFYITSNGDPSVGIPGQSAEVRCDVPHDMLEFVRKQLKTAFEAIWDERATVLTEAECNAEDGE